MDFEKWPIKGGFGGGLFSLGAIIGISPCGPEGWFIAHRNEYLLK